MGHSLFFSALRCSILHPHPEIHPSIPSAYSYIRLWSVLAGRPSSGLTIGIQIYAFLLLDSINLKFEFRTVVRCPVLLWFQTCENMNWEVEDIRTFSSNFLSQIPEYSVGIFWDFEFCGEEYLMTGWVGQGASVNTCRLPPLYYQPLLLIHFSSHQQSGYLVFSWFKTEHSI